MRTGGRRERVVPAHSPAVPARGGNRKERPANKSGRLPDHKRRDKIAFSLGEQIHQLMIAR
jgi:hypothetical protein